MDVDLRDLELLDTLADAATLTAAAERLYVSQPALSQRLTKLEDRLGVPLFDREGRRLVPNTAGRRMLTAARHVLAELRAAQRDVRDLAEGRGRVRFAAQCTTTFQWLPPVIRAFRDRHPGVEVRVDTAASDEPIPALLDDRLDVALVVKPDARMGRVEMTPIFEDELVAVVGPGHPWQGRDHLTAGDFDGVELILYDSYDQSRIPAPALPLPPGSRPGRVTTMPVVTDLIIEMVAAGSGVSVLPTWVAQPYVAERGIGLISMDKPMRRTWYCATRTGALPEHVRDFADELAASLAGAGLPRGTGQPASRS